MGKSGVSVLSNLFDGKCVSGLSATVVKHHQCIGNVRAAEESALGGTSIRSSACDWIFRRRLFLACAVVSPHAGLPGAPGRFASRFFWAEGFPRSYDMTTASRLVARKNESKLRGTSRVTDAQAARAADWLVRGLLGRRGWRPHSAA